MVRYFKLSHELPRNMHTGQEGTHCFELLEEKKKQRLKYLHAHRHLSSVFIFWTFLLQ